MQSNYEKQGKKAAIIAYITIIGTIIAFYMNQERKNKFSTFHIRQALGLWITFYLLIAISNIFDSIIIYFSFFLFSITLIIYGLRAAFREEEKTVPILGSYFQEWFTFIK